MVLGVAQDGGLPHLGCEKPCCVEARRDGRRLDPACVGVRDLETGGLLMVEATPGIERQAHRLRAVAGREGGGRNPVDAILLTHAHIGHYAGLVHLGREVASSRRLPVWTSPRMAAFLRANGPWSQLVELDQIELHVFEPRVPFSPMPGLEVTAIPVPHRDEFSDTHAFKLRGPEGTLLFLPDIDRWEPALLAELLDGVDRAYLDGTFYDGRELPGRDLSEIPHPPMVVTMDLCATQAAAAPGRLRFIHLNHTNPALRDRAILDAVRSRGFAVAEEGERFRF
ncbi:MAG: MBL fold metallo-hydrolase [Planctomycetota bacterium]